MGVHVQVYVCSGQVVTEIATVKFVVLEPDLLVYVCVPVLGVPLSFYVRECLRAHMCVRT